MTVVRSWSARLCMYSSNSTPARPTVRSACAAESRLMRSRTGNSMIELRRDDERDGEQQDSVTKAVLFHAVAILRSAGRGLCALGHGCALMRPHNIATPYSTATLRMRTTVSSLPAGLLVALAGPLIARRPRSKFRSSTSDGKPIANVAVYATSPAAAAQLGDLRRPRRWTSREAVRAARARRADRHRGDVSEQR